MAVFCIGGTEYIGYDDPQMLAQVFFLCGFLVYIIDISGSPRFSRLALAVSLFIVGGNVKHSLLEFPLAVLIDLALANRKRALQYLLVAFPLLAVSIYAGTVVGGPSFVANILTPRVFSFFKAFTQFMEYGFGPASLAMIAAAIWSVGAWKQRRLRVLAILFWLSVFPRRSRTRHLLRWREPLPSVQDSRALHGCESETARLHRTAYFQRGGEPSPSFCRAFSRRLARSPVMNCTCSSWTTPPRTAPRIASIRPCGVIQVSI